MNRLRDSVEETSKRLIVSQERDQEARRAITQLENEIREYDGRIRRDKELSADRESLVKVRLATTMTPCLRAAANTTT